MFIRDSSGLTLYLTGFTPILRKTPSDDALLQPHHRSSFIKIPGGKLSQLRAGAMNALAHAAEKSVAKQYEALHGNTSFWDVIDYEHSGLIRDDVRNLRSASH